MTLRQAARDTVKVNRCSFFPEKIKYIEQDVRPGQRELSETTTAAVRKVEGPKTHTEQSSFLILCIVFRRCVPRFSIVASPLNKKLQKGQSTSFPSLTQAEKNNIETLNALLSSSLILALPRAAGHFTVDTDACDYQVG